MLHCLTKPIYKELIPIVGRLTKEKVCIHRLLLAIADSIYLDDAFILLVCDVVSGTCSSGEPAHCFYRTGGSRFF
jgi:hypothetical protein